MPKIYVKKPFKLQHPDKDGAPTVTEFPVGNHDVTAAIAAHWFVKAHVGEEPTADADSAAVADELLAELEAKAQDLDAREKHVSGMEKAMTDHMAEITRREEALAVSVKDAEQRGVALDEREAALAQREQVLATAEKAAADAAAKTGKK